MRLIEVFTYIYGGKIKGDGGGGDESPGACIGAASELWVVEFWFWPEFRVGSPTKTVCPAVALSKCPKPLAQFLPKKSNARGAAYQCKVGVD